MPYTDNKGKEVPDCVSCCLPSVFDTKDMFSKSHRYIHGDSTKCCCPFLDCCKVDCTPLAGLCKPCQDNCVPVCAALLSCEATCQTECSKLWNWGPEVTCKSVGCELTCGQAALEDIFGTWHLATTDCPEFCPSVLFPCGCFGACPPGLGQDETFDNGKFAAGGPTETQKVPIVTYVCGALQYGPLCMPHTYAKQGWCGLCMDPIFGGGELPCWYCNETRCISVSAPKAETADNNTK